MKIVDVLGLASTFQYHLIDRAPAGPLSSSALYQAGLLWKMTTPYGVSTFEYSETTDVQSPLPPRRAAQATDPLHHTERLEFRNEAPGVPAELLGIKEEPHKPLDPEVPGQGIFVEQMPSWVVPPFAANELLQWRNTFYWDKHAFVVGRRAAGDLEYLSARISHWTHDAHYQTLTGDVLESVKQPLEGRIWFAYAGQASAIYSGVYNAPTAVARQLGAGQWQVRTTQYNEQGNIAARVDPVQRSVRLAYAANGIDLTAIDQKTSDAGFTQLLGIPSHTRHRPDATVSASFGAATFEYDGAGQLRSWRVPLRGNVVETAYARDGLGRVTDITVSEINPTTSAIVNVRLVLHATYDAYDRIATLETEVAEKTAEGIGRQDKGILGQVSPWRPPPRDPIPADTVTFKYDALNRVVAVTYPDGTVRTYVWDKLDLVAITDRTGLTTHFEYDAERNLKRVIDPLGLVTAYDYYENGALHVVTDPGGNETTWDIDLQSRVIAQRFANGTATVYAYEDNTSRLKSITDALGQTKTYTYEPDDRLAGIAYTDAVQDTPDVTFAYDPFYPRVRSMSDGIGTTAWTYRPPGYAGADGSAGGLELAREDGPFAAAANASSEYQYDEGGRLVQAATAFYSLLAPSAYDYLGRVTEYVTPIGSFVQEYLRGTDRIVSRHVGKLATRWVYDSNLNDRRLLTIATDAGRAMEYVSTPEGDIRHLTEHGNGPDRNWSYGYDDAGRLLSAGIRQTLGPTGFGPAFPDDQYAYVYDDAGNITSMTRGGHTTVASYNEMNEVMEFDGVAFRYDANGNVTDDGQRLYEWDAENRLISITYPDGNSGSRDVLGARVRRITLFKYDGLGRRLAIVETEVVPPGAHRPVVTTETRFVWCGSTIAGAIAFDGHVHEPTRGFARVGQANIVGGGTGYSYLYYAQDHLGSVRDVIDGPTGTHLGSSDYDPFGRTTHTAGDVSGVDFGYAGMFLHHPSGLYLTRFRTYDARTGRWLSRDPIGRRSGRNLYAYADNDPINGRDPYGLQCECPPDPSGEATEGEMPNGKDAEEWFKDFTVKRVLWALEKAADWAGEFVAEHFGGAGRLTGPVTGVAVDVVEGAELAAEGADIAWKYRSDLDDPKNARFFHTQMRDIEGIW